MRLGLVRTLLLLSVAFVAACGSVAGQGGPSSGNVFGPSRRVSECRFWIGMSPNSAAFDRAATDILRAAAEIARRNDFIVVVPGRLGTETTQLAEERADAIRNTLPRLGILPERVRVRGGLRPFEFGSDQAGALVYVCGANQNAAGGWRTTPENPDHIVRLRYAGGIMSIPVVHFGPLGWNDLPFEPLATRQKIRVSRGPAFDRSLVGDQNAYDVSSPGPAWFRLVSVGLRAPVRAFMEEHESIARSVGPGGAGTLSYDGPRTFRTYLVVPAGSGEQVAVRCFNPQSPSTYPVACHARMTLAEGRIHASADFYVNADSEVPAIVRHVHRTIMGFLERQPD